VQNVDRSNRVIGKCLRRVSRPPTKELTLSTETTLVGGLFQMRIMRITKLRNTKPFDYETFYTGHGE